MQLTHALVEDQKLLNAAFFNEVTRSIVEKDPSKKALIIPIYGNIGLAICGLLGECIYELYKFKLRIQTKREEKW